MNQTMTNTASAATKLLFINGCVDRTNSRTNELAKAVINKKYEPGVGKDLIIEELDLETENILPLNAQRVKKRMALCANHSFEDAMFDYAKQFAAADIIVMATPYWDMSFPAMMKEYIENICIVGLTFGYDEKGVPKGLCKAKKLIYVTTSGGPIRDYNLGYDYVKGLCERCWRIMDTEFISAEGLDVYGNDARKILDEAISQINGN